MPSFVRGRTLGAFVVRVLVVVGALVVGALVVGAGPAHAQQGQPVLPTPATPETPATTSGPPPTSPSPQTPSPQTPSPQTPAPQPQEAPANEPSPGAERAASPFVPGGSDTTYDRIEADVQLVAGIGAAVGPSVRPAAELRVRFLSTAGVYVAYEDAAMVGQGGDLARLVAYGIELRPLFLARWLQGWELGSAFVDLLLDSFGLELGAFSAQRTGTSSFQAPGLELGLGLEIPLFVRPTGLWLGAHGGMRFGESALSTGDTSTSLDRTPFLRISLAWHQLLPGQFLVGLGDRPVQ